MKNFSAVVVIINYWQMNLPSMIMSGVISWSLENYVPAKLGEILALFCSNNNNSKFITQQNIYRKITM